MGLWEAEIPGKLPAKRPLPKVYSQRRRQLWGLELCRRSCLRSSAELPRPQLAGSALHPAPGLRPDPLGFLRKTWAWGGSAKVRPGKSYGGSLCHPICCSKRLFTGSPWAWVRHGLCLWDEALSAPLHHTAGGKTEKAPTEHTLVNTSTERKRSHRSWPVSSSGSCKASEKFLKSKYNCIWFPECTVWESLLITYWQYMRCLIPPRVVAHVNHSCRFAKVKASLGSTKVLWGSCSTEWKGKTLAVWDPTDCHVLFSCRCFAFFASLNIWIPFTKYHEWRKASMVTMGTLHKGICEKTPPQAPLLLTRPEKNGCQSLPTSLRDSKNKPSAWDRSEVL